MIRPIQLNQQIKNPTFCSDKMAKKAPTNTNNTKKSDGEVKTSTIVLSVLGIMLWAALAYIAPQKAGQRVATPQKDTITLVKDTAKKSFDKVF